MPQSHNIHLYLGIVFAVTLASCASPISQPLPSTATKAVTKTTSPDIDVTQRALPTQTGNIAQPAHYQHVYIDTASNSAESLQTISLEDAVKHNVLASSDLQVKPLSKISQQPLQWAVFDRGFKTPSEIEGVGGAGVEANNFTEVNFDLNGTEILNTEPMTKLIEKAKRVSGVFHVVGYADETGTESGNTELATERAKSVAQALITAGINRTRVIDSGAGVSRIYSSLAANRRASVTFRIEE